MQRVRSLSDLSLYKRDSRPSAPQPALDAEICNQVTNIPLFAKFKTHTLDFNFTEAAQDPTTALQQLHHLGALLINSGKAYSALLTGDDISTQPVTEDEIATKNKLIGIYNAFPNIKDGMIVEQGHPTLFTQSAQKIFHALLVLRVALDHLPAEKIYLLYEAFMNQNRVTRLTAILNSFADGSALLGSYAAEQVLHRYIVNNLMLFTSIPLPAVEDVLKKESKHNQLLCLGGLSKREEINSIMMMKLTTVHQLKCDSPATSAIRKR